MGDFWQDKGNDFILALIMLILGVILAKPLEALLKWAWKNLEAGFISLGLGFQKRYFDALINEHHRLKLIGAYSRDVQPPRLKEIYVSLRMQTSGKNDGKDDSPAISWERIFDSKDKNIVILGQPGAGKSTLLDYLILIFTGHIQSNLQERLKSTVPLYARLKDLSLPDAPKTLLGLLEWSRNIKLEHIPTGYFESRLKKGRCIVLLDGLDEVLNRDEQDRVVAAIKSFANEYNRYGNWMIVTCRSAGWEKQLPDFRTYTVTEFDKDDIRKFIGAWYREVLRSQKLADLPEGYKLEDERLAENEAYEEARGKADGLWNDLRKKETLLRIAHTPLILSLITLVYKNSMKLPEGRAKLYEACLDILLDKWDSEVHRLNIPNNPTIRGKLLVLRTIAFHFLEHALLQIEQKELEGLITPLLPSLGVPELTEKELIEQINQRSGVLDEKKMEIFEFAHRALHDYLAASYIAEHGLETILLQHAADEPWREVILIAVGQVKPAQAKKLINALLEESGENPASLALTGWSLAEDIQIDKQDLRARVTKRLCGALERVETASDFYLLTDALQTANPPALQNWLKNALASRDPALRRRALGFLPELGLEESKAFAPLLVDFISDEKLDAKARALAVSSLAQIKIEPDREIWNVLMRARQESDESLKTAATWALCELGKYEELGLVKVPAGEFLMGSADTDSDARDNEKPQHTLYMPAFYIGKYPVTVAQYSAFVQESGYKTKDEDSLKGTENHPVVNVSWHDALTFARWQGMTLPSEVEWEKAARGTDGRVYPWGNDWRERHANTDEFWESPRGWLARLRQRKTEAGTIHVGFFSPRGDSPYGCADMSGNVYEWTRSVYAEYPYQQEDGRENLEIERGDRVLRGGSFYDIRRLVRCAVRYGDYPLYLVRLIGFRVAVSPIFVKSEL